MLNCHVGIHNNQVHFCISVPVFALDVGPCLFLGVSSVFGKRKSRLRAIGSRNGPWERLVLTQRTLGMVSDFPMIPGAEPIIKFLNLTIAFSFSKQILNISKEVVESAIFIHSIE